MNLTIREVGPRDGLQSERPLTVADRLALVRALVSAGLREIEVAAFVSPRAVPAMAGAPEVVAGLPPAEGMTWWALVPNVKGAELAAAAGIDHLTMTVSASETYSRRNVGMSTAESLQAAVEIASMAPVVDVAISAAFGSPYEGEIAPSLVASLAQACRAAGAGVTLADTTGMATPRRVQAVLDATGTDVGLHLHDTRGTALLNAYVAMEAGVRRFDTAVGGLGGSPFAAGAGGNLATEDLVHLCDDLDVRTGIDLGLLLDASALVAQLVGRPVPSRVAAAGPRGRLADGAAEG
ncbi:MAG TPA: hydroxymethylglutaryl-CoA lyase [Acidimicrobiales bacterium]|nr:hydroxymethylglutaryl-CoA lyase [Acidimicrobiales bacterium]